jgi:hypothetical protein
MLFLFVSSLPNVSGNTGFLLTFGMFVWTSSVATRSELAGNFAVVEFATRYSAVGAVSTSRHFGVFESTIWICAARSILAVLLLLVLQDFGG